MKSYLIYVKSCFGDGKMAQLLRPLVTFPGDPSSVPKPQQIAHSTA